MSKAFTKEEQTEAPVVAPRAPLPPGVVNYVTPRGLSLLRAELRDLLEERARLETSADEPSRAQALAIFAERKAELESRIASATLVDVSAQNHAVVRFGAAVTVSSAGGEEKTYRIVGIDEADAAQGRIAFVSPLARALLGRAVGDPVTVRTPRGEDELEISKIEYVNEASE